MSVFRAVINIVIILGAALANAASAASAYKSESNTDITLINEHLYLFSSSAGDLTISQAIKAFQTQQFSPNNKTQVSFGFTLDTLWAMLPVTNERLVPTAAVSASILFALLKKAAVSKSSLKGKNGQFPDVAIFADLVSFERIADHRIRKP